MVEKILGRYELLSEVGRGGMSTVYLSRDTALDREVAVKVLHPHLASRQESCERFLREARAVARLRHPNIVEIYDYSADQASDRYIVTEYISGANLREFVERHAVPCPELGVALAVGLCQALAHAHSVGIIHRDIKPENVMIQPHQGRVKLTDFGIAHVLDAETLTTTGSLLGSPAHMPPEMIDGEAVDFRGDIFSLGTVLYFLVTDGQLPFTGKSPSAVLRNILEVRYVEPAQCNPRISRRLSGVIRKCLAREPQGRYQDIEAVEAALRGAGARRAELAALELGPPEVIAAAFIADPTGYAQRFEVELVARLHAAASAAVGRRDVVNASDLLNRILLYRPDDAEALALLERLQVSQRRRWLIGLSVAAVLLAAVGYGLASQLDDPAAPVDPAASLGAEPEPPAPSPAPPPETPPAPRTAEPLLTPEDVARLRVVSTPAFIAAYEGIEQAWREARQAREAALLRALVHGATRGVPVLGLTVREAPRQVAGHRAGGDGRVGSDGRRQVPDRLGVVDPRDGQSAREGAHDADARGPEADVQGGDVQTPPPTFPIRFSLMPRQARVQVFSERGREVTGRMENGAPIALTAGRYSALLMCEPGCKSERIQFAVAPDGALSAAPPARINRGSVVVTLGFEDAHVVVPLHDYGDEAVYLYYAIGDDSPRLVPADSGLHRIKVPGERFKLIGQSDIEVTVHVFVGEVELDSSGRPLRLSAAVEHRIFQLAPGDLERM